MQLRTLYYNKKYYDLLIKYIHFDEYGSDKYPEEVKRIEEILNSYEPIPFNIPELVQIIRTVFKNNNENYLHIELSNDAQSYNIDFYDESLANYEHITESDKYIARYSTNHSCLFETGDIENSKQFMNKQMNDIETIKALSHIRPVYLTSKMSKLIDLYEAFYGRKIDVMSDSLEEELTYMLFLINQYEINLSHENHYTFKNNRLVASEELKDLVFKLRLFVDPFEEQKKNNLSLYGYVERGVEGRGSAIATHFGTRSPEEQLRYLRELCLALNSNSQDESMTRTKK